MILVEESSKIGSMRHLNIYDSMIVIQQRILSLVKLNSLKNTVL